MQSIKPANNVLAAAVAGAVAGVSQHFMVHYGVAITPDMQDAVTGLVMFGVAHAYDLVTGQNVPPTTHEEDAAMAKPPTDLSQKL